MGSQEESPDVTQFTSTGENEGPMEEGPTSSWADETSHSPKEGIPIPDILTNLINHGKCFKSVSHRSKTTRPMLVKNLSVYFSVDTVVTSQAILEAFDDGGIEISSIQW